MPWEALWWLSDGAEGRLLVLGLVSWLQLLHHGSSWAWKTDPGCRARESHPKLWGGVTFIKSVHIAACFFSGWLERRVKKEPDWWRPIRLQSGGSRWQCLSGYVQSEASIRNKPLFWQYVSSSGRMCLWSWSVNLLWAPSSPNKHHHRNPREWRHRKGMQRLKVHRF